MTRPSSTAPLSRSTDHRDQQASAECRSRLIAALLMTMAATVGLT